jgi:hypothetical protein
MLALVGKSHAPAWLELPFRDARRLLTNSFDGGANMAICDAGTLRVLTDCCWLVSELNQSARNGSAKSEGLTFEARGVA